MYLNVVINVTLYIYISYLIYIFHSDGMINRNQVSEISGVFLESESEEVDLIFDLTNDSSSLIVRLLKVWYNSSRPNYIVVNIWIRIPLYYLMYI